MKKYIPVFLLIILAIAARLIPHPANFTPIAAIALFAGIYLPKKWALVVPLVGMFISDIFIGFYSLPIMAAVYACFIVSALIGIWVGKNKKFRTILGGTLLGSVIFFIFTNLAVWIFGTMYAHNLNGFFQCFYMALPFFRNSLAGDLLYTGVLVGGMELVIRTLALRAEVRL